MEINQEDGGTSSFRGATERTGINDRTGLTGLSEGRYLRISEKVPLRHASRLTDTCFWSCSTLQVIIILMSAFTVSITTALVISIYAGARQSLQQGGVISDHDECTNIGMTVLRNGGTSVDASIAINFCLAVVQPHLTGLGGGGFMLVHKHGFPINTQVIDFIEVAPNKLSLVGVPGFVRGMTTAHKIFGKLPLNSLILPAANLAKNGVAISNSLNEYLSSNSSNGLDHSIKSLFYEIDEVTMKEKWRWPELAQTLETIAQRGPQAFYSAPVSTSIVDAVEGTISEEDLAKYSALVTQPLVAQFNGYQLLTTANSSAGASVIEFFGKKIDNDIDKLAQNLQNSFFHAVEDKETTDPKNPKMQPGRIKDYHGATTSIVFDSQEVYVVTVSGLGSYFGSNIVTSTGIVLNDALPASSWIRRRSRLSSNLAAAVVFTPDQPCGIRLVAGSGSGQALVQTLGPILTRNWTSTSSTSLNPLSLGVQQAVEGSKIFLEDSHNLVRETITDNFHVEEFSKRILEQKYVTRTVGRNQDMSTNVGGKIGDFLVAHADTRKYGSVLTL